LNRIKILPMLLSSQE